MTFPHNAFKEWMQARRKPVPLGTWMMTHSAQVSEALGFVGFDFLVLDMEHVPVDSADAVTIMRALEGTPTKGGQVVVRLPWNDAVLVKRVLDGGATTLMFPFIQNAEEAKSAVASTRYPLNGNGGTRGCAAVHRASRYGAIGNYLQLANDSVCTIMQIETPEALANIPEIAAVEGVDAIFIGPGDLSANMGHLGNIANDDVRHALKAGVDAVHAAGKPCGIVLGNPEMVRWAIELGYDFVAIGSDMSMMLARAKEQIAAVRGVAAQQAAGGVY
ncbi:HpcH/HpaI aldolase family protein [Crenobacter intestini]|uniref:2-dehydro-3-deoxyglucarate aldolase n=1 Tax=Crenobacter intestini TaxID=2563443 RepID=A0A4T0UWE6_9NEIS|nr:aldolase/citrate lyase family protein [Crenobacter intestini]TIC83404.1 2-dehydro-3-deoxyglucarate aldolase [Crenobacter intestini]